MILAEKGIEITSNWYHDPKIKNINNDTVATILAR